MVGASALEFLHWAWVARQYHVFAQALEVLVPNLDSLDKFSQQHPSYYYQAAAKFAQDRKDSALRLCQVFLFLHFSKFTHLVLVDQRLSGS